MTHSSAARWQLPDGINELLPGTAWHVELLRRGVIDLARARGYDFVSPPLVEYLDSLLTGVGETLGLQTVQFVDQGNGRTLGIRADMTPQVARMDARSLAGDVPNRFVYTGSVLRSRTDNVSANRSPLQFGAELFGDASPESDVEIIRLMLDTVMLSGRVTEELVLDLGHVGVYESLAADAGLAPEVQAALFDAIQRGSRPDVDAVAERLAIPERTAAGFRQLLSLHGDATVLDAAEAELGDLTQRMQSAIGRLRHIVAAVGESHPAVCCHVDLAELRGFRYHTGAVFAVLDASGQRLAQGGRYDNIGKAFGGHARAATGFSGDLVALALPVADRGN